MLAYLKLVMPTLQVIDHVILSHPRTDHVELMPDVLRTYDVLNVWDSGRLNDVCGYRYLLTAIRDKPTIQYHNALQDFGIKDYTFTAKQCDESLPAATIRVPLSSRIATGVPISLGASATMTLLYADGAQ